MATSRIFRMPPNISLDKIHPYTYPPTKPASRRRNVVISKNIPSGKPNKRLLTPTTRIARAAGLLYSDGEEKHPIVIKDDSDSEAEGTEAERSEADMTGPELDDGDDSSSSDSEEELRPLEDLLQRQSPNTEFAAPDKNQIDDLAKSNREKENTVGDPLPTQHKRKLDQLNDMNHNSDNSTKGGTENLQPHLCSGSPMALLSRDCDTPLPHNKTSHDSGNHKHGNNNSQIVNSDGGSDGGSSSNREDEDKNIDGDHPANCKGNNSKRAK